MADLLPYEPNIANDASKSGSVSILETDFGDGYSQRADDGINNYKEEWSANWNLYFADALILETFLKTHGADPFIWTPPGESAQYFIVRTFTTKPVGNAANQIQAVFKKVFDIL